jgi:hypothetical protein
MSSRANLLAASGRFEELGALLDGWQPGDPVEAACKARALSRLTWRANGVDDLAEAEANAAAIPDADARRIEQFWNTYESSFRTASGDGDPYPLLAAASKLVGGDIDGGATREVTRARRIALRNYAGVPIVSAAIVLALLVAIGPDLALYVGMAAYLAIGLFWKRSAWTP